MGGRKASKAASSAAASRRKSWTALVYMAGDNNLTEEMTWGIQQMWKTCADPRVADRLNLVVQFDPRGAHPRRYDIVAQDEAPPRDAGEIDGRIDDALAEEYNRDRMEAIVQEHIARECLSGIELPEAQHKGLVGDLTRELSDAADVTAVMIAQKVLNGSATADQITEVALRLAGTLARGSRVSSTTETSSAIVEKFVRDQIEGMEPAENYIAVLSGHGSGAVGNFLQDSDPRSSLSIPQLGCMLRKARGHYKEKKGRDEKLAILGMDTCLMSNIEVGYEVRDSVRYLVGSEGFVLNGGWPYHRVLEVLAEKSDPEEAVKAIVDRYLDFYQDYETAGVSTDISACDLGRIGSPPEETPESLPSGANLATALKLMATRLIETMKELDPLEELRELEGARGRSRAKASKRSLASSIRDAVLLAHWYAQSYKREQYVDLYDFCDQLLRFCPTSDRNGRDIRACCERILRVIEGGRRPIVVRSSYRGPDFQHSHGLSMYFPWAAKDYAPEYRQLRFASDTRWGEFLELFLERTLRVRRHQEDHMDDKPTRLGTPGLIGLLAAKDPEVGPRRDPEVGPRRDPEVGPRRDPEVGPRRFISLEEQTGFMKNPPDGFYRPTRGGR